MRAWCLLVLMASAAGAQTPVRDAVMAGYLLAPNQKVPGEYDSGFSVYVSAWPLLEHYPGRRFQTGLFGTWMFPVFDPPVRRPLQAGVYTDIEGGLGWWRDTRFATATPKFIMGGVDLNFRRWANGPGAGKGRDWDEPKGKYGVVQLSNRLLWPPDGLNLAQGTRGDWFGYGYLPLPLTPQKQTTAGKPVATGNRCWTLFLSAENFKGPVAFFAPYFWTQVLTEKPELEGKLLDSAAVNPNRALQMETQYVPAKIASSEDGQTYARVAPVRYPVSGDGSTRVVQQIRSYRSSALWDDVARWFDGGEVTDGSIDPDASVVHDFTGKGAATWRIYDSDTAKEDRALVDWNSIAQPSAFDGDTFGYRWRTASKPDQGLTTLPDFFRLDESEAGKKRWVAIAASEVPSDTGLREVRFEPFERPGTDAYQTPERPESDWKRPGPVAGPFLAYPGDGSEVTYYWYRFADQPAMLNADLTETQRQHVQRRIEMLHQNWTTDRDYLPPQKSGSLAAIDGALVVTPPKGLEIGYVPIVTRQGQRSISQD
ncbi:hypothetical protein [Crateriforma spongiae]|uniref:hypothetical protein n=1 Tax=Crateriforma spongiae TaxID=2724528 RepID=UPI001F2A997F|nr:hypothetical protein [Crateriforma spongiae]